MSTPSPSPTPYPFHALSGVAGNTTVLTRSGPVAISTLVGQSSVPVWNGTVWILATIWAIDSDDLQYTVTLHDGRSLTCNASFPWYVRSPSYTTFLEIKTEFLVAGSAIWYTLLETDVEGAPPSTFPTIASVVATGESVPLFCVAGTVGLNAGITLAVYNGILTSAGYIPPPVTEAPAPTPSPSPSPSPSPDAPLSSMISTFVVSGLTLVQLQNASGTVDPIPAEQSEAWWLGILHNGQTVTPDLSNTSANTEFTQDPFYTFELPAGATSLVVTLTDNEGQQFEADDGWLMVRRGSQPSSNDNDSDANDYLIPSPPFVASIPDVDALPGTWYVSLDVTDTGPIDGITVNATWVRPAQVPPTVEVVIGDNGALTDGQDFLLTIPAGPGGGGEAVVYWEVTVPFGSAQTLNVVLDDNATGDLAAQLSDANVILILTKDAPYSGNIDIAMDGTHVPMGVSFVNAPGTDTAFYLNIVNAGTQSFENVRLLLSCVPSSATDVDSLGGGSGMSGGMSGGMS